MRHLKFTFVLAAMGALAASAQATTLSLSTSSPGATMGAGRENAGFNVNIPVATGNFVQASNGVDGTPDEKITAIDFAISIPAGQQIDSAVLTLHVMSFGSSGTGIDLPVYGLNTTFTGAELTWNSSATGTPWTVSGAKDIPGDIDGSTVSITNVTPPGSGNTPVTWDVKDIIQAQYSGGTLGNGLLVGGRLAANFGTVAFAGSAQIQGAGTQPQLEIIYSVVPEPSSLVLVSLSLGLLSVARRRAC